MQRVVALCLELHPPDSRLQNNPVPVRDARRCGRVRVDLQERLRYLAPQTRDMAVLLIAELPQPKEREYERVLLGPLGTTDGTF